MTGTLTTGVVLQAAATTTAAEASLIGAAVATDSGLAQPSDLSASLVIPTLEGTAPSIPALFREDGSSGPSEIRRIFVANRGEAAVRDIRSIRDLYGDRAEIITVYTEGDEAADYVRMANRAILIDWHNPRRTPFREVDGRKVPVELADNFNDEDRLVETARRAGARIFSVKWGFKSESASLCEKVEASGMLFNGPGPKEMARLGHKWHALEEARKAGLPVGKYSPLLTTAEQAIDIAQREFNFPNQSVMVKDCLGGGGTGNFKCENAAQLKDAVEKILGLGHDVYFEEFVGGGGVEPKHVEIQGFGDGKGGSVTFGARDCSVQTEKHQKIIEQTYSTVPLAQLREMEAKVRTLFQNLGYRLAGTVEFLVEGTPEEGFRFQVANVKFMEVNTRLQVEHTISEMSFGQDISRLMYEMLDGASLPKQENIRRKAISLEVRVTAENDDLKKQTGTITEMKLPEGPGVRTDFAVSEGSRVGGDYDSMIGKIIVTEDLRAYDPNSLEDEEAAMREAWEKLLLRAERALKETRIHGLKTNLSIALEMIRSKTFRDGNVDTKWVPRFLQERRGRPFEFAENTDVAVVSAAIKSYLRLFKAARDAQADRHRVFDERSLPPREGYRFKVLFNDFEYEVAVSETSPGEAVVRVNGSAPSVRFYPVTTHVYRIEIPGLAEFNNFDVGIDVEEEDCRIRIDGCDYEFKMVPLGAQYDPSVHVAPVEGKFWLNGLQPGQPVLKGQSIAVLSVMKSEQDVPANHDGVASQIFMDNPAFVDNICPPLAKKQPLSRIEASEGIFGIAKKEGVARMLVKAGDSVREGDVLAIILRKKTDPKPGEEEYEEFELKAERGGVIEWAYEAPPVTTQKIEIGGQISRIRVVPADWVGPRAYYPNDQQAKDPPELQELKKKAIHPRFDPQNLAQEGPFALVKFVKEKNERETIPPPPLPFFAEHSRDPVLDYRFVGKDDRYRQLQEEIQARPDLLPQVIQDLSHYYMGYDYPSDYVERAIEVVRAGVQAQMTVPEGTLLSLHRLAEVHRDVWALFGSTFDEFFYILERHDFTRNTPRLSPEFEKALLAVANHFGIHVASVRQIPASELGVMILRLKMARRDSSLRRTQFEKILEAIKHTQDERFTEVLKGLYGQERHHHDARRREAILDALASVSPEAHRVLSPAQLSQRHVDTYERFLHNRLSSVSTSEREIIKRCILAERYEGGRPLPREVQNFLADLQRGRPTAIIRRVRTPYTNVFAFEVNDERGRSLVTVGHWSDDVNFTRGGWDNRIVGSADLEDLARDAARSVHIYRALHQQLSKKEELRSKVGADFTRNEVYLLAHSRPLPVEFTTEGPESADQTRLHLATVHRIAANVEAFFHSAEITTTNLIFRRRAGEGQSQPPPSGDADKFSVQIGRGPQGMQVSAVGYGDLFRKITKTEELRQQGKWPIEDQAREFFDGGRYEPMPFRDIEGVDYNWKPLEDSDPKKDRPVLMDGQQVVQDRDGKRCIKVQREIGAMLARGLVNGKEYYAYFTDFRVSGGAFGDGEGTMLVAANLFAYLDQTPLVVFNDGAGANIKEGTISLDRSAEDFMMKVVTGGFGDPERFLRYIRHHPDQKLFRQLIDMYRRDRKVDDATFNDLVSKVRHQLVKIAAQIGAGIGMVVYGSSLEESQLMVDHPTAFRELTGSVVIAAETGQSDTDHNMGGAPLHASQSGEIDEAFRNLRALIAGIKRQLRFFDPRRMVATGKREKAAVEATAPSRDTDTEVIGASEIVGLVDRGEIVPFKTDVAQGRGAITMFAQLGGVTVGILGARTQSGFGTEAAIFKATQLIRAAEMTRSPIVKILGKSFVDPYRDGSSDAVRAWGDYESRMQRSGVPHIAMALDPEGIHAPNAYRDTDVKIYVNQGKLDESQPEGREALDRIKRAGFEVIETVEEAFDFVARILPFLNHERAAFPSLVEADPINRPTEKARALLADDHAVSYDSRVVIGDIFDKGSFVEIGRGFNLPNEGPSLITGFATMGGKPVMVVADDVQVQGGTADALGAEKYRRAKQLARLLKIPVVSLGDSPAFKPGRLEEVNKIQHRGASSIRENILSEVPEVHILLRRGFGGRYIQDGHPWLRPGTRLLVVRGAMAAVMGPEGAASLFKMRKFADLRTSDPLEYMRRKREAVEKYKAEGWGDPAELVKRGVADGLIEKNNIRNQIAAALGEAELDVETAFKLRYNILTTRERRVSALMEWAEALGYEAQARSTGEGQDEIVLRSPQGTATIPAGELHRFFQRVPQATTSQLAWFLAQNSDVDYRLNVVAARAQLLGLKETLGFPVEERPDGALIVGAGQVFATTERLLQSYFMRQEQVERVSILIQTAGAEIVRRFHYETTDSTMYRARDLANDGALDGTVVTADVQTAGQGRMTRAWLSTPGSMMMSVIRRKPVETAEERVRIQFATSLAVARTLGEFGADVRIKWPNDVYLNGSKVAGIKIDSREGYQVIGVGVNVNTKPNEIPEPIRGIATSLFSATGQEVPMRDFEDRFVANLEAALREPGDRVFEELDAFALYRTGDRVDVVIPQAGGSEQRLAGTVMGIDGSTGDLLIRDSGTGERRTLSEDNLGIKIRRV